MPKTALLDRASTSSPKAYAAQLAQLLANHDWTQVEAFADVMEDAWRHGRQVFLCGNGGSAANAIHIANDFVYPVARSGGGMRVSALPANPAVLTCLANDLDYTCIFSRQLEVFARPGDILVALTGSGNSENVLRAVETARFIGMKTVGILGFGGGRCIEAVDLAIHFPVDDMQIAEDLQLVVGHMVMQSVMKRINGATSA
jgi:D-sedoheptulose 7-phosphate isomerase